MTDNGNGVYEPADEMTDAIRCAEIAHNLAQSIMNDLGSHGEDDPTMPVLERVLDVLRDHDGEPVTRATGMGVIARLIQGLALEAEGEEDMDPMVMVMAIHIMATTIMMDTLEAGDEDDDSTGEG